MSAKTYPVDAGGTARLTKTAWAIDSGSVARKAKKIWMIDSGGTPRLVFLAANAFTIVAGAATFTGYNNVTVPTFGSISPSGTLNDGRVIQVLRTNFTGDLLLQISGFASDPGAAYVQSLTILGATNVGTAAVHTYSAGSATWDWSSGAPSAFINGSSYPGVLVTQ